MVEGSCGLFVFGLFFFCGIFFFLLLGFFVSIGKIFDVIIFLSSQLSRSLFFFSFWIVLEISWSYDIYMHGEYHFSCLPFSIMRSPLPTPNMRLMSWIFFIAQMTNARNV